MDGFFQTHRKGFTIAFNLLFWIITCYCFVRFSVLRPMCNTQIFKEFVCFGLIVVVVLVTRWITVPILLSHGRYGLFWLFSIGILVAVTIFEILLVKPEIESKVFFTQEKRTYLLFLFGKIFLRDACFFAWFLVFRLYVLQKDTFRAKQRASVMEHQSVQFSTPDHKEISIPIDIIIFIQKIGHITQVHCTGDESITVEEPLSYCKEMIPDTLWTSDGLDKIVFYQHLSEFFQNWNEPEIREIKTITMLSDRQFRVFNIIRKNPGCNATFIYKNFQGKVTQRTIERDLATLRSKEVITHMGTNRDGGYKVCNLNVVSAD